MNRRAKVLLGLGLLAAAPACFAQYTLDLTGVGNGTVADGVYVSPYQGTVMQGTSVNFSGYMICDDFNTESYLNTPWNATTTTAGALNGSEKFGSAGSVMFSGNTYTPASLQCGRMARERPARQSGQHDDPDELRVRDLGHLRRPDHEPVRRRDRAGTGGLHGGDERRLCREQRQRVHPRRPGPQPQGRQPGISGGAAGA